MADPHHETKRQTRRERVTAWYGKLGRKNKIIAIASGVSLVLLIIALATLATLTFTSITRDDLALYLAAAPTSLALEPGSTAELAITADTKNLPFCTAHCTYTITDRITGVEIATGETTLSPGRDFTTSTPYTAPPKAERDGIITVTLRCANTPTNLCKSDGTERFATVPVRVATRYPPERLAERDALVRDLAEATPDLIATKGALAELVDITDPRVRTTVGRARDEEKALEESLATARRLVQDEDFATARQTLATLTTSPSLAEYDDARDRERALATQVMVVATTLERLHDLEPLLPMNDRTTLRELHTRTVRAANGFATSDLTVTEDTLATVASVLGPLTTTIETTANTTLTALEGARRRDTTLRCLLYGTACPAPENVTNESLAERLTAACTSAEGIADAFADDRLAFARRATNDTNATVASAALALDTATVLAQPGFTAFRTTTLDALRNGTPLSLTPAQALAFDPEPLPEHQLLNCSRSPLPALPLPQPTLPSLVPLPTSIPDLAPLPRQCCDDGSCVSCPATQRTPVVFVHGFSFAQGTTPESNLNAFGPLTAWLDDRDTIRYVGHVFPQERPDLSDLVPVTGLPGRYAMTATYYYDSYSEDGSVSLVAQKSENLETYALRLREAIEVAKARTGEDRVIIVAHSMGGLVTRRYLQLFGEGSVVAVVMLGTPNDGITGRTQQLCGVFGSELECRDMERGSLFLTKLANGERPTVPVYTIVGTGCDTGGEDGDGVITRASVELPWATNIPVNGTCSGLSFLHNTFLDPALYPTVAQTVEGIIGKY